VSGGEGEGEGGRKWVSECGSEWGITVSLALALSQSKRKRQWKR
jgi:hypothetical protein